MNNKIQELVSKQRNFFNTGATKDVSFRLNQLMKLKQAITANEREIFRALKNDLNKSEYESYLSEVGLVMSEINHAIKKLRHWAKPKRVSTPLALHLASSYIYNEPLGVALIVSPWNFPLLLLFSPLVGAIAAGNCCLLKPSEVAPAISSLSKKMITENFDEEYLAVIEGGIAETQQLLAQKFDYIFFTGGTEVGRIVYQSAAKHLTPVTLELGGKSPCLIDADINLALSAQKVAWGKFTNCGQTCVAPDYLLIDKKIKKQFIAELIKQIKKFYGEDAKNSQDYCRIINERHFARLESYLKDGKIIYGGKVDKSQKYIEPTLIEVRDVNTKIMQDEIFGPILPLVEYEDIDEAINLINSKSKPLALYIFSNNPGFQNKILQCVTSGGVTINDTVIHLTNPNLPFGGVGDSGIGAYHGKSSFETFSHKRSVLKKSLLLNLDIQFPPYKYSIKIIKKIMEMFL